MELEPVGRGSDSNVSVCDSSVSASDSSVRCRGSVSSSLFLWIVTLVCLSVPTSVLSHTPALPVDRCDLVKLFNRGKCRLGACLTHEVNIPGNSFCDTYSLYWAAFYTRCLDRPPCCLAGGQCRVRCFRGEWAVAGRTDCGASGGQCCVTGGSPVPVPYTVAQLQGACGAGPIISPRIVGGAEATPTDWPWVVRLVFPADVGGFCSGVLVDDDTVLTVAHCVERLRVNEIQVYIGEHDITRTEPEKVLMRLRSVNLHPDYRSGQRGNDLAILKLDGAVIFTSRRRPACLPDPAIALVGVANGDTRLSARHHCHIAGWGLTEGGRVSNRLRSAPVQLMDRQTCSDVLADYNMPDDVICTDTSATNADACQYDDGDMLVCLDSENRYPVVGLVSDYSCGRLPTQYTSIAKHTQYILERL